MQEASSHCSLAAGAQRRDLSAFVPIVGSLRGCWRWRPSRGSALFGPSWRDKIS